MTGGEALLIRADASARIGAGHVMRCLALAQAWQETGGEATFLTATRDPALRARLESEGVRLVDVSAEPGSGDDARQAASLAGELGAAWVVADGYHFDAAYQEAIKDADLRLLFLDDNGHADRYCADLVLNQNIHADEGLYPGRAGHTRLLLGTRYALLRREFWPWRGWRREVPPSAGKLLVTLGGSDPDNVTMKVIRALERVEPAGLAAVVVAGGANPHYEQLRAAAADSPADIRLERNVTDMPALMAWADLAVSAGGSTSWELALMALPNVITILAENQRVNSEVLGERGAAVYLGWGQEVCPTRLADEMGLLVRDQGRRQEMSRRARALVDGKGSRRVVGEMLMTSHLRARPATSGDVKRLFDWANDPDVRRMSFHSEPIPWEDHLRWLDKVTHSPEVTLMIVELAQRERWISIGQVRVDGDGTVSISIAPEYRGRGLAEPALRTALAHCRQHSSVRSLTAYIKKDNVASQRLFVGAGFVPAGEGEVAAQPCLKFTCRFAD